MKINVITWWRSRSRLEKILIAASLVLVAFCIILAIALGIGAASTKIRQKGDLYYHPSVCLIPGCVQTAAQYLENANLKCDPCEDFYEFVCGNFDKNAMIHEVEGQLDHLKLTQDVVNNRLRVLLEEKSRPNENKAFVKTRAYYAACMNKTEINLLGNQPLKDIVAKLGGWPVVEGSKWTPDTFDFTKMVKILRSLGLSTGLVFKLGVTIDKLNNSRHILTVDRPPLDKYVKLIVPRGIKSSVVQTYLNFMVQTAVLLGANKTQARVELEQALLFEMQMISLISPEEKEKNFTELQNKMTVRKLEDLAPQIKWVDYINSVVVSNIDENEEVIVLSPDYVRNVSQLIFDTDKRILANYFIWRVVMPLMDMLDDRCRAIWLDYQFALLGEVTDKPRWRICLLQTKNEFHHAIDAMYIRRHFDDDARKTVINLAKDIRREFITILENVNWMDDITNKRALIKAKAMDEVIAYPIELFNDTAIENFYRNFTVTPNAYFHSTLNLEKEWHNYAYKKLRKQSKRNDWREVSSLTDVNAANVVQKNLIVIPAGIIQGVYFGKGNPKYVNYGAIGSIIGHEITHGFDNQGRQFDEKGNLKGWWEPESDKKFHKKASCIIQQYSNFNVSDVNMPVDGELTQGENIADNGGVKEAYKAYERWIEEHGEELPLPGLNLTARQFFWMSFANIWCSRTDPTTLKYLIRRGKHSPDKFRVNGVVSNSLEFSKDFNCPIDTPMNPKRKCVVW